MLEGKQRRAPKSKKANRISPADLIYGIDTCCMQLILLAFIWISHHMA